jgi:biotin carboxyl carrier protein
MSLMAQLEAALIDGIDEHHGIDGESLDVAERVVVAPAVGVFRPSAPETVTAEGEIVRAGQELGVVEGPGLRLEVRSPFAGFLMGLLARPGERVREGQPVAWLRTL